MINWKVSFEDEVLIEMIVDRAVDFGLIDHDRVHIEMDIVACHNMGNPLDLQQLLDFDGFNFLHDVIGIINTIDRDTGKLTKCFSPRCSKHEVAA